MEDISVIPTRDDGSLDYRGCSEQERIGTIEEILKKYKKIGYRMKEGD